MPPQDDADYLALTQAAALLDLSDRSRLCVLGGDREKFLHGQVTNDLLGLRAGQGAYAALVTAKGRIESDLFIYKLNEELLLDFEPGLAPKVIARLERYVIAEDVQIVDVSSAYKLLSVQGPAAESILKGIPWAQALPQDPLTWRSSALPQGELYIMRNNRFGPPGFDLFVPAEAAVEIAQTLKTTGARRVNTVATETVRIENAIPRYGVDMDESNLAPETGIQKRAISYAKGCYIGQEIIARIRTYGQVAKALRLVRFETGTSPAPRGTRLFHQAKEIGSVTSSAFSPKHQAVVALAYVRKEANAVGTKLTAETGEIAEIIAAPESV